MATCSNCSRENPADFEFCGHCGSPMAGAFDRREERKLATILFADLSGSTELGSRLDPERLQSLLQRYFAAMAASIESWGGTVEKYVGDAVMAVFGVPAARENDAERAVRAALEMQERLAALNPEFQRQHGVTLRLRIGVNTGDVIAPAGDDVRQRIVAGDAVNVAARLEQAARPGTILVGERTQTASRRALRFDDAIELELKGKTGVVRAYPVRGREPGMEGVRPSIGLAAGMVGRDREIDLLTTSLGRASVTREVRTVFVYGPAGIGKSRLLDEFTRRGGSLQPVPRIHRGRCPATGRGIGYWALGEILRSAFEIALDDAPEAATAKLQRGVGETFANTEMPEAVLRLTTDALAVSAGLSVDGSPLERMEPHDVGEHIARAWPRFVSALAGRGPVVLVFEDLHWAGEQLLDLLHRLASGSRGPALLVATARPEFTEAYPGFGDRFDDATTIRLDPLSRKESEELVAGLLADARLPSSLLAEILGKAEGNPLFLEEMIGRLVDEGALVHTDGEWVTTPSASLAALPDTIHAVLAARIDSLPPIQKRTLQEASVVGRSFWEDPVARALGRTEIADPLQELRRKGFVQARPTSSFVGHAEFQFRHALIRDVAYESLSMARRARAHAEIAAWVADASGGRSEEVAELIAHHYATAVIGDADLAWLEAPAERDAVAGKAFDALLFAGRVARRRYAVPRAVELHEQAIVLAPGEAARAGALEEIGDDHDAAIHGDAALSAYRAAIAILRALPEHDDDRGRICMKAAKLILERSGAFSARQEPVLIDDLVDEGLASATQEETRAWLRALWGATAIWWIDAGVDLPSSDDRVRALGAALSDARVASRPELEAFSQEYLCEVHMARGSWAEVAELSRNTDVFERIASPAGRSLGLVETAIWAYDVAGETERALRLGMRAYDLAKELSPHDLMHATGFVISALHQMGRWGELDPVLDEHVAAFEQDPDATCELLYGGVLAGATRFAQCGDVSRARELVALAPPFASTDPLWAGYADCWRARFRVSSGDPRGGLELARGVLADAPAWPRLHAALVVIEALTALGDLQELAAFLPIARDFAGGLALLPPTCDRAEGDVEAAEGDPRIAHQHWIRSLERFERLGVPFEAAQTKERLAAAAPGDVATSLLEEALETYDRMGAGHASDRVRRALAQDG